MADQTGWLDAPAHPQTGERVFQDKQRRQAIARILQNARALPCWRRREHDLAQILRCAGRHGGQARFNRVAESRERPEELASSAKKLSAAAREHEDDVRLVGRARHRHAASIAFLDGARHVSRITCDDSTAVVESAAAVPQRVGGVGKIEVRRRLGQELVPTAKKALQSALGLRRECEEAGDVACRRWRHRRSFFDNDVRVGAADAD